MNLEDCNGQRGEIDRLPYKAKTNKIFEPREWKEIEEIENPHVRNNRLETTNEEIISLRKNKIY